ncbi:hypothetical protein MMC13_000266 [Lambiella insularis]|nr:hypothetical protein [Lambiella insularis]
MAANLPPLKDVEQLSPLVTRILGGNPSKFTLQGTNTYLIGRGPSRLLLDTGQGLPAWTSSLSAHLSTHSLTVSTVLLTHHHHDHTLGVPALLALCPHAQVHKHPSPPTPSSHGHTPLPPDAASKIQPITDGQVFTTDGATLKAMHTPGHTPDHMCFLLEEEGALFTGDNVLGHGTAVFESLGTYMASLERMSGEDGFVGRAYPGHGEVIAHGKGRVGEYIQHRRVREEEVLGVLRGDEGGEGKTPREVVRVVYRDVPVNLHDAAEGGVVQVLEKLEGEGRVEMAGEKWRCVRKEAL